MIAQETECSNPKKETQMKKNIDPYATQAALAQRTREEGAIVRARQREEKVARERAWDAANAARAEVQDQAGRKASADGMTIHERLIRSLVTD